MAIPAPPSVTTLCTAALKQSGFPSPTTEQVTELSGDGFQTIKTQMWQANEHDRLLEAVAYVLMAEGKGHLSLPADFDHELAIDVYSADESSVGTAQAAATETTLTLASTFASTEASIQGKLLFITGGTGVGQYRQILTYDDTTKIATLNNPWQNQPNSTSTYLIGQWVRRLTRKDEKTHVLSQDAPQIGYPTWYTKIASAPLAPSVPALQLLPAPDHARYACLLSYTANLTKLDEASALFIKHLQERRAVWQEGLKLAAMGRYDDDRYAAQLQYWETVVLPRYAAHNSTTAIIEGHR